MKKIELTFAEEDIKELAEKEIVRYVSNVMETFQRSSYHSSDKFDPRMQNIVESTIREIIYKKFLPIIEESIKNISVGQFVKLVAFELHGLGILEQEKQEKLNDD